MEEVSETCWRAGVSTRRSLFGRAPLILGAFDAWSALVLALASWLAIVGAGGRIPT